MSDISFNCPQCGAEISADSQFAGDTAQCPSCNSILLVPMPGITEGMHLGDFRIIKRLGLGGMGEVWLAEQEAMKRQVALKILAPHLTKDEDFVNRFMQEVQLAGKLTHPNIVTAFHAGEDQGIYYLAMEFIDGCELENLLSIDKTIDEATALKVIRDIAEALDYAWSKFQILHRDIKPSNIMISSEGEGLLMDMGISKSLIEDNSLTMAGEIIGTPYYMSPEQAQADQLDFRADLYSLGATLYHVVTGSTPYDGDSAVGILTQHITAPLPSPKTVNSDLSDQCSELIKIMMMKDPAERHTSWKELIEDIDLVLNHKFPKKANRSFMTSTLKAIDKACLSSEAKPLNKAALIGSLILVITALIALTLVLKPSKKENTAVKDLDESAPKIEQNVQQPEPELPVRTVPKPETASNEAQPKENRSKEIWLEAINFDDAHVGEFDVVINNYKNVLKLLIGTEFEDKAKNKIKSLYAAKESAINQVMEQLENDARNFVNRGEFKKVVEIYESYTGELAAETEKLRYRKALHFSKMKESPREQTSTVPKYEEPKTEEQKPSIQEDMTANVMLDICAPLIEGKYEEAYTIYKNSDNSSLPQAVGKVLSELNSLDKIIVNTLEKYYKTKKKFDLTINTSRGECLITEFDKRNKKMRVDLMTKYGTIKPRLKFSEITTSDHFRLLKGAVSNDAYAIHLGNEILKSKKDTERAIKEYKKASHFYPYIEKTLFPKSEAELAFIKLLKPLNLDMESVKLITKELLKSNIGLRQSDQTREDLKQWRDSFKNTTFFKEYQYVARNLYDLLWAYTILNEEPRIKDYYETLKLSVDQVIKIDEIIQEQNELWEQRKKIMIILTPEQRQQFHESRPGRSEERQGPGGRKPFKRR